MLWPYSYYSHNADGHPLTDHATFFLVGPNDRRFKVHSSLLGARSPAFCMPKTQVSRNKLQQIWIPGASVAHFRIVATWLYEGKPPPPKKPKDLIKMCRLWLLMRKMGLWRMCSTMMRLGMEIAQPMDFKIDIDTVKYIYENTTAGDKLRGYVIAMFAQRNLTEAHFFRPEYEHLSILKDTASFLKMLGEYRKCHLWKGDSVLSRPFRKLDGSAKNGYEYVNIGHHY